MSSRVKVRGIHATALSKLLLDAGHAIVQPSPNVLRRIGVAANEDDFDIFIHDRPDYQGVHIQGDPAGICRILHDVRLILLDAVLINFQSADDNERGYNATLEFPGAAKRTLDRIRAEVAPTLPNHHRFLGLDSESLRHAENLLESSPAKAEALAEELFYKIIMRNLDEGEEARIEHIKASGKQVPARRGMVWKRESRSVTIKRRFREGRYDGLDLPIERGDYGLTTVNEGDWYIKHAYFSAVGTPKGEYYNINTPVELYPFGARYVDLEVDVVRRPGEAPRVVDQQKTRVLRDNGVITAELERKAMDTAESIMAGMTREPPLAAVAL